jgi:ABC-2 type transport system ATP-binding protein
VLGAPIGDRTTRAGIGYLPELFRYQPWLRAREVLELHARLIDAGSRAATIRVTPATIDATLGDVGLLDRADDVVGDFSKGMQQRLGLGVALLGSPPLVVLDEPTSALDPVGRMDVRSIIGRAREAGSTVFLNSHLLGEVERVCDRVAIVDHGRVLESGRLDDLLGDAGVRIRVTDLPTATLAEFDRFGSVAFNDGWLSIAAIEPEAIPDVVASIVNAGGRVHAVDVGRTTLEDRFLRLVGGAQPADAVTPIAGPAPDRGASPR